MKRLCLLILVLLCVTVSAQDFMLHSLERESVTRIVKTASGIMLLGTDNGLVAYNGKRIMRFSTNDCHRPYNFVNDIAQLPDGTVLVGMRNGLYVADQHTYTCRRIYQELSDVASVICDKGSGNVYVACQSGLAIVPQDLKEKARIVSIDKSNITSAYNHILCAATDNRQNIWFANSQGTLMSYNTRTQRLKHHIVDHSLLSSTITSIATIGQQVYIATLNSGLLRFNPKTLATEKIMGVWSSVKEVKRYGNSLYICTDGDGAYTLRGNTLTPLYTKHNSVYSCFHDQSLGMNWFGYYQNGADNVNTSASPFRIYRYKSFDSRGIFVRSFCKTGRQTVIGSLDGIYYIDEGRDITLHFSRKQIGCAIITDIKYFAGLFIIASYEHGLLVLNPSTLKLQPLFSDSRYSETSCSKLVVSPDSSRLYVGSSAGLICLDRHFAVTEHYDQRNTDILGNFIYDMVLDRSGKLWVSTSRGMRLFNTQTQSFQNTGYPEGFWHNVPNLAFSFTHDGNILAASETSLLYSKADLSSTRHYPIMQRYGLGHIDFMLSFGDKYITGTDCGLFVFDNSFNSFCQYSEADGLPSARFTRFTPQTDKEGNIWMANRNGLVYINAQELAALAKRRNAKVYVDEYTIERHGQTIEIVSMDNSNISVGWNFGTAQISVTPNILDYNAFQNRRYYQWTLDDGEDSVTFDMQGIKLTSLSLGKHTLRIQLAGHPETMTVLTVSVYPSTLFYVELFVIVLLIIIVVMVIRLNKRKHERERLIEQRHKMEIQLASINAVNIHKQQEKEQHEREIQQKQQEKENQLQHRAEDYKTMFEKIDDYMKKNKPYLRANLRLSDLATHAGTNATTLSQMFNDYLGTTYFDYVNHYRLEEFKYMIKNPTNKQLTILATAEQCGFRRSSFFTVFKKFEGCTPNEWVKKNTGRNNADFQ